MVNGQAVLDWVARYNGTADSIDVATDITTDNVGNVYVTGYSTGLLVLSDYTTIKYDPNGNQLWVSHYNGPAGLHDKASAIAVDNLGNVYVTGSSVGLLTLGDIATIKYDPNGNQVWVKRYNGLLVGDDAGTDIIIDNNGDVLVTGYSVRLSGNDYTTIKYNSVNGNEVWVATYNGPGNTNDVANELAIDDNGRIFVVGESNGSLLGNPDYAVVAYDGNGNQQWVQRYNGPGNGSDKAYAIVVDGDNNVIITGESTGSGNNVNYTTIKYDNNGNHQWTRSYNGTGNGSDKAYAIVVDNSDNVYVTGSSMGSGTGEDYATVKYNEQGSEQWVRRYNGSGNNNDKAYAIVVDGDGNPVVTGSSNSSSGEDDYTTISYDENGNQNWLMKYNGPGNSSDKAYAIVVDNSDNVIVTGGSKSGVLIESEDYATVKYSQSTTTFIDPLNNNPGFFGLSQNYPNPFNPVTNIEFNIKETALVNITVYNLLGIEIDQFSYSRLSPGTYTARWDATGRASGLYLYKIKVYDAYSGNMLFNETKKMLLIK